MAFRSMYNTEEKQRFVAEYMRSGVSMSKFCRGKKVAANTLSVWARNPKLNQGAPEPEEQPAVDQPNGSAAALPPLQPDLHSKLLLLQKENEFLAARLSDHKAGEAYWADQYTQLARAHATRAGV